MSRDTLAVILAAGEGTRMKSAKPKVLHEVAHRSMLAHVLAAVECAGIDAVAFVIGPDRDDVAAEAVRHAPKARVFVQRERRGTAHAVLAARDALVDGRDVIVLYADTPLVTTDAIFGLKDALATGAAVAVLGFEADDPTGYGRLVMDGATLARIVEERDADEETRKIRFVNGGLMALAGPTALSLLEAIDDKNAKNEFYITDAVALARSRGLETRALPVAEEVVQGINDRKQLAAAEAVMQNRLRDRFMREGVTLLAPETVFFAFDTVIGRDVVIEPHCFFGRGVKIADNAVIHAFSSFEGATIEEGATVGPYARLRPGTLVGPGAKIGNFVETKAARIDAGAKVNHLSYIGDASIGANANIGAGTITCNYDGFLKYKTTIGANAFIGSNSALVAPVTIGEGGYVGSGSVITEDVPADALAIARGRQATKPGWAASFRATMSARKAAKTKD
jgi:bifunctional UDP-N-acetylglucosamine pyrophosphorylase/glucosamine-1-phosphate N-acetyltransferase